MARPSKPDHVKKAQGTLQPCRVNNNPATAELLSAVPDVPEDVPEGGGGYFTHVCNMLLYFKKLTAALIPTITRISQIYDVYQEAQKDVAINGAFQTTQSGYSTKSGAWTVMTESHNHILAFEKECGFTLASSQKISIPDRPQNETDFD